MTEDPFFLGKADKLHVGGALRYLPRPGWEHSHSPAGQAPDAICAVPPLHTHTLVECTQGFLSNPHGVPGAARKSLAKLTAHPGPAGNGEDGAS